MIQTNFMEEIDCGNFFDHIDDLLEFPNDDVENGLVGKSSSGGIIGYDAFPPLWTGNSLDPVDLPGPGSEPAFSNGNSASDLSAELSVPYEDIVQLEWLSTFVEDSFSGGGLTVDKYKTSSSPKDSSAHQTNQFQTSSPISVLESSSACSNNNNGGKTLPVTHEKRARSKRPRPATFTPRPSIQLMAPHSESESAVESRPFLKKVPTKSVPVLGGELQKKKKKIKILPPSGGPSTVTASQYQNQNQNQNQNGNADTPSHPVRKCLHCEITKTPQWRAGPLGPKTLCNACGVRYKSGRLYPEYRPAASPTFVPSLHSNSHKKVLEMRTKTTEEEDSIMAPKTEALISPESELLPAVM